MIDSDCVLMGNHIPYKITDISRVETMICLMYYENLFDVRHIPYLRKNLNSLDALDSNGYWIETGEVTKICKGAHCSDCNEGRAKISFCLSLIVTQ